MKERNNETGCCVAQEIRNENRKITVTKMQQTSRESQIVFFHVTILFPVWRCGNLEAVTLSWPASCRPFACISAKPWRFTLTFPSLTKNWFKTQRTATFAHFHFNCELEGKKKQLKTDINCMARISRAVSVVPRWVSLIIILISFPRHATCNSFPISFSSLHFEFRLLNERFVCKMTS